MKLNQLDRAQLDARLLEESPEFTAAYSRFPATHWSRYDLSAVRLGWELAREVRRESAGAAEIAADVPYKIAALPIYPDEGREEQFGAERYRKGWNDCRAAMLGATKGEG